MISIFINKYIDHSLSAYYCDVEIEGEAFDYYGHNLIRYEDVEKMLEEIMETSQSILSDKMTDNVKEIVLRIKTSVLFGFSADLLSSIDALRIYERRNRPILPWFLYCCTKGNEQRAGI